VLYAPTYSAASSLHLAGEAIVAALAGAGLNVIVKLHDRSLDPDPRYTDGIDWRARMRCLERAGQIAYVEGADASPLLAAADAMVTDHSSAGFEFLVTDRPLIVFDAPDLPVAARINPDKVALLRSAATVVQTPAALADATRRELRDPTRLAHERRRVAREVFHEPGTATRRAVELVRGLLGRTAHRSLQPAADPHPLGGGIS
jgi:CDP-glycerol glycerophosphotransferase (TagB/SpsB family)